MRNLLGLSVLFPLLAACTHTEVAHVVSAAPEDVATTTAATTGTTTGGVNATDHGDTGPTAASANSGWLGAAAVSDAVLANGEPIDVGVWVDAPQLPSRSQHVPLDIALVIDTSGSMSGAKIERAREAAKSIVSQLSQGDVVSITTFSDRASIMQSPTGIADWSRPQILAAIDRIVPSGSTNLFAGLQLGEQLATQSDDPRFVRRVVLLSDGKANVGPSDRASLAMLADRGLQAHAQITSLGIGLDYDEQTLDALAVRSGGRLYHLTNPEETAPILEKELALLQSTVATDAYLDIAPAPGVRLADANADGHLSIPLGAMFGGQHRQGLVKAYISRRDQGWRDAPRALASVQLRYRDPSEGGLDRVQEVIARVRTTDDVNEVSRTANSKAQVVVATIAAGNAELVAAGSVNSGKYDDADQTLAQASADLSRRAASASAPAARAKLADAVAAVETQRHAVKAARSAPSPSTARESALKMNSAGMSSLGY